MREADRPGGEDLVAWPAIISRSIAMSNEGLICGARSVLARMADDGPGNMRLALDTDGPRLFAMLSIAFGRPVSPDILIPLEAAASHWSRGDKALANLRLIFADLPKLREPADAYRMCLAEHLLDEGMAPETLMKALELAPTPDLTRNYDPDEPRVPAGNGRKSGEWDFGGTRSFTGTSADRIVVAIEDDPNEDKKNLEEPAHPHGAGQLPEDRHGFEINPLPGLPLPGGQPMPVGGTTLPATANPTTPFGASGGRLGSPATRALNAQIGKQLEGQGYEITGGGGSLAEEYIKGQGPGTRGSTYVDISATHSVTGEVTRVQTVDTRTDGSLTPREAAAAARIRGAYPQDKLYLIRKK